MVIPEMLEELAIGNATWTRCLAAPTAKAAIKMISDTTWSICFRASQRELIFMNAAHQRRLGELFDRLAIDVINGGPALREWVDDATASPADLDALAASDEVKWREEVAPLLRY